MYIQNFKSYYKIIIQKVGILFFTRTMAWCENPEISQNTPKLQCPKNKNKR